MKELKRVITAIAVLFILVCCLTGCSKKNHTVTFDNGVKSQIVTEKGRAIEPYFEYDTDLYTFEGWYVDKEFTMAYDFSKEVVSDVNLYALLTPKNYSIKYDLGYDSTENAPTQKDTQNGGTFTLAQAPSREGYVFKGWSDGSIIKQAGETYTVSGKTKVLLTARWETAKITVRYIDIGLKETILSTQQIVYGGNAIEPAKPMEEVEGTFCIGYTHDGKNITRTNNEESNSFDIYADYINCINYEENFWCYTINASHDGWKVCIMGDAEKMMFSTIDELVFPSKYKGLPCVEINDDELRFTSGMEVNIGKIVVPSSYKVIKQHTFNSLMNVAFNEVELSEGLEIIEPFAFNNPAASIKEISIPSTVIEIGLNAFAELKQLQAINVDDKNPMYMSHEGVLYEIDGMAQMFGNKIPVNMIIYPRGKSVDCYTLPASVVSMEMFAIEMGNTKKIDMSQSKITEIPYGNFMNCVSLQEVVFPSTLKIIGDVSTKKEFIRYGAHETFTAISSAFQNCTNLKEINIPEGVEFIGAGVFGYCGTENTIVSIPSSLKSVGVGAFEFLRYKTINVAEGCNLFTVKDDVLYDATGKTLIVYPFASEAPDFVLPEEVTAISSYAFSECKNLTKVTLNSKIKTLKPNTFYNCQKLKEILFPSDSIIEEIQDNFAMLSHNIETIAIPASVKIITFKSINGINGLKNINVSEDNEVYSSVDGVLYSKDRKTLYIYPFGKEGETFTVPNEVEEIFDAAFRSNNKLMTITLNNGLKKISDYAFAYSALTTIVIPASVIYIGNNAFNTGSLRNVTMQGATPPEVACEVRPWGTQCNVFNRATTIYVPDDKVEVYRQANGWSFYASKIKPVSEKEAD